MERIELVWDEKQSGVYCIRNKVNGKVYIGSSKDCYHRIRAQHFYRLQRNIHTNPHLQSAWNKYGKQNFEAFCLEICSENILHTREQYWISETESLNSSCGYNINPYADRTELTEKQRLQISLTKLGVSKNGNLPSGIKKVKNNYGIAWKVTITYRNVNYYLGVFKNLEDAKLVREKSLSLIIENKELDWKWIRSLRSSNKRSVIQLKNNIEIARYPSSREAARRGFVKSSIIFCCRGLQKHHHGFQWRFA